MNSKWKKTTSLLCALTVAAVPMALNVGAGAPENSDKGALVNEAVQIGEAYVEGYILTIPARFDIQNEGWNEIGDISAVGHLADGKKLVVSADSANHWGMKNEASGKYVNYDLKNSAEGETTTSWEFTSLSETPAVQTIGIDVEPFKGKDLPAGEYTDVLTFTAGVKTKYNNVDLSTLTANYEAQDGDILTGIIDGETKPYKITVADGATITLKNAVINGRKSYDYKWAGITLNGDATIILEETNTLKGFWEDYPGIYVPEGKTLTIKGNGSLDASSNGFGAGIGGGYRISCGNIVIESGTITATGGRTSAGIGDGNSGSCGNITINGGTVTATGGDSAPGIGSGYRGSCVDITINGGTVTATGSKYAAGIGGGANGSCGNITIANTVTKVTATKGVDATNSIGAGNDGNCGDVIIGGENKGNISESPYVYPPENSQVIFGP